MSHDTVIHHLIRPAVLLAARTQVTPNQVTTVRLATGLAAACMFAKGSHGWMMFGGLVFLASMLLDRFDGELARQTNQMSSAGHRYDLLADCIASVATFVALGIGQAHTIRSVAFWLGVVAGLGVGVLFFELNVLKIVSVNGRGLFRVVFDPDDAMIFVPVLVWCDLATPMIVIAAVITPLAAAAVGAAGLRRRRGNASGV